MKFRNGNNKKNKNEIINGSTTLKNRLWILQTSLVIALITGIIIVLILTGTFEILNSQSYTVLSSELERTSTSITRRFFTISQNTYELSNRVNKNIHKSLDEYGLTISDIKLHPEILNPILNREVEKSISAMQKSNCSGVFVILDATVNPSLPDSKNSKSGFYIRNIEPHPVSYSTNIPLLLRGSPEIARDFGMYLDTEWQLELDTNMSKYNVEASYYVKPFRAALKNKYKDIKSMSYWSAPFKLDENSKKAITFSVPLIDKNGLTYGVCGLELSERFFNSYMPPIPEDYDRLFYILGVNDTDKKQISISDSIHLGAYSKRFISSQPLYLSYFDTNTQKNKFNNYYFDSNNTDSVVGLETKLNIYNSQSIFKETPWVLIALIPPNDIAKTKVIFLAFGILLLLIVGVSIAYYLSNFYTKPISHVFKQIIGKSDKVDKTNIIEINDLLEFLKQEQINIEESINKEKVSKNSTINPNLNTRKSSSSISDISDAQYKEFTKKLSSLTKTEREIFDMYIQGYSAKQICDKRYISINTVKTHNRRIYAKINVSSRSELLSYCYKLMREYTIKN